MTLKITPLGGASQIGASSILVQVDDTKVVIDCGVRFEPDRPLPDLATLSATTIDAVLITHAHSDHTGGLPVLHDAFPAAPIYMTPPTLDLVRILQKDALKLMGLAERESEFPLYSKAQVEGMLQCCLPVQWGKTISIGQIRATWLPAGHILGASMIYLETPYGHLLFTGDYSIKGQLTVDNLKLPPLPVDILVTETTYGNRLHEDRGTSENLLIHEINEVIEREGRVLIPAFAIGRAQELLVILRLAIEQNRLPKVPIYVDGMVRSVSDVYHQHPSYCGRRLKYLMKKYGHPFFSEDIKRVDDKLRTKIATSQGSAIIIASSGMLSGGASAFYAKHFIGNEKDAIFITGYQDEESPGRKLLELASKGGKGQLKLGGESFEVRCTFSAYRLSAHADKGEIMGLISKYSPRKVLLVHGDLPAKEELKKSLDATEVVFGLEGKVYEASYRPRKVDWDKIAKTVEAVPTDITPKSSQNPQHAPPELHWDNPKASLLELCKMRGWPEPQFLTRKEGALRTVKAKLEAKDKIFDGKAYTHLETLAAEQLSAQDLLDQLCPDIPELEFICEEKAGDYQSNFKGPLFEQCLKLKLPEPICEMSVAPKGFAIRYLIQREGLAMASKVYSSVRKKVSEQAACKDLLDQLNQSIDKLPPLPPKESKSEENPLVTLNQLKQKGMVSDFGYCELEQSGAAHAPSFGLKGWVAFGEKKMVFEKTTGRSKKEAQKKAAAYILQYVRDHGGESSF